MYTGPHISVWFPGVGSLNIRGEELFTGMFVCGMKAATPIVVIMDLRIAVELRSMENQMEKNMANRMETGMILIELSFRSQVLGFWC